MSIRIPRPSFKLPQRNKPVDPLVEDDLWRSGRDRWGIQNFRRGRDKRWHFSGQGKDEIVKLVVRKHWLFLIRPALPLLGSVIAFFGVLALHARMPALRPLWIGLEIVIGLLILGTAIWFLYKDFVLWWLETYIITDKRIINSRGLLEPTRQETPIEKVTQIGVDIPSLLGFLLDYGTVHVYVTGGDFFISDVPHPKEIRDAIQGIYDEIKAKKPPKEKLPEPTDKDLKAVLDDLAKGKPIPTLPDADAHYPPRKDGIRSPRRTFGGPLHIPCEVHYSSDEYTVMYIQRSRYVLYRNLALPFFLLLLMLPLTFFGSAFLLLGGLATVILLITMFVIYVNYVDNVFILSTRRIIEIERTLVFFVEARTETEYKFIRDTKVKVPNIFQRLLDIGDVFIETPGTAPDITFSNVDHPFVIQDKLNEIRAFKEKVEKIEKENSTKEELNTWFSKVVTTLEKKVQSEGAPNLQDLDFWSAAQRAREFGLRVVVIGEATVNSSQPPGQVVQQFPLPGTLMVPGSEIQVVLSKRPRSTTVLLEH
jgi:hypothetical protein